MNSPVLESQELSQEEWMSKLSEDQQLLISEKKEKIIDIVGTMWTAYFITKWPVLSILIFEISVNLVLQPRNLLSLILLPVLIYFFITGMFEIIKVKSVRRFFNMTGVLVALIWIAWQLLTQTFPIVQVTLWLVVFNCVLFLYWVYTVNTTKLIITDKSIVYVKRPYFKQRVEDLYRNSIIVSFDKGPWIEEPFDFGTLTLQPKAPNAKPIIIRSVRNLSRVSNELKVDGTSYELTSGDE